MNPCNTDGQHIPGRPTPLYIEDLATSASLTLLAADPNKHPQVYGFIISTDTPGTYTLAIGGTTVGKYFFGATAGLAIMLAPFYFSQGTVNQDVTLSKPANANTAVTAFIALV